MKCSLKFLKSLTLIALCGVIMYSCRKDPSPPDGPGSPEGRDPGARFRTERVSDRLLSNGDTSKMGVRLSGSTLLQSNEVKRQ